MKDLYAGSPGISRPPDKTSVRDLFTGAPHKIY